ncbi:MAG: hypothetical protein MJ241_04065 [Bacilli bacterium]|nr:hypothetical protein [Bacilli bacterium]
MKGNSPLFEPHAMRGARVGDISFMGNGRKADFARNASRRKDVDPDGLIDVVAHGSAYIIEIESGGKTICLNSREAGRLIKKYPAFKKSKGIRLLSCSTGSSSEGFAQHLANSLGKVVFAPTKRLWALPNGHMYVSSDRYNTDKGEFMKFIPGGVKHGNNR